MILARRTVAIVRLIVLAQILSHSTRGQISIDWLAYRVTPQDIHAILSSVLLRVIACRTIVADCVDFVTALGPNKLPFACVAWHTDGIRMWSAGMQLKFSVNVGAALLTRQACSISNAVLESAALLTSLARMRSKL